MFDLLLPLVVVGLVATAVVARRVLRPPLSTFIALCAGASVIAYASLEVYPWVRTANLFQPVRVQIEPQAVFGAGPDGRPSEIAVQVFRGTQLLEEKRIPALGKAAALPAREPLRLERLESGGFRVMSGKTSLGQLSDEALARAGAAADAELPLELGEPPDAKPEIDVAATIPDVGEPDPSAAAPAASEATRAPPRVAKARRAPRRAPQSEADREVELRARASQLSRQGNSCEGERLLRDQARDERSIALARELGARCRWKSR